MLYIYKYIFIIICICIFIIIKNIFIYIDKYKYKLYDEGDKTKEILFYIALYFILSIITIIYIYNVLSYISSQTCILIEQKAKQKAHENNIAELMEYIVDRKKYLTTLG